MLIEVEHNGGDGAIKAIMPNGTEVSMLLPAGVHSMQERPSFAQFRRGDRSRLYIAGGLSENIVVTARGQALRQFIRPIDRAIVNSGSPDDDQIGVTAVSGTGPTGACIPYLRWLDPANGRRSPLSGPGPSISMDGSHGFAFTNVPARPYPDDPAVSKIEVWISRNGAGVRRIATRDAGATSFTVNSATEYEEETVSGLRELPRCRYNAIYHERLWSAGDATFPNRIYFSPLERLDEFAGDSSYLTTRNGEPVTGLVAVRDVLVVLCPTSSYTISGYSQSDFEIRVLEPQIGGVSHHGIDFIHDHAVIPSHQGVYLCSGTSMALIPGDYATLWTELYTQNPLAFELGFGVTDRRSKVYKFFMEDVTTAAGVATYGEGRFWVFDYRGFSPQESGGGAPMLSFDVHGARAKCAAMVADPGSRAGNLYTAFTNSPTGTPNRIVAENQWDAVDTVGDFDAIIHPAFPAYEPDGGPKDGLRALVGWLLVYCKQKTSWVLEMMHGPAFAAVRNLYSWAGTAMFGVPPGADPAEDGRSITPDWPSDLVAVSNTFTPAALPFKIGLNGEGISVRLKVTNPIGLIWNGWGATLGDGDKFLALTGMPRITTQPEDSSIASGNTETLSVVAAGEDLLYEWFMGPSGDTTNPLASSASSSYETSALVSTTAFWVRVSNFAGSVDSDTATVTVT